MASARITAGDVPGPPAPPAGAARSNCQLPLPAASRSRSKSGSTSVALRISTRRASNGQKASFTSTARSRTMSSTAAPGGLATRTSRAVTVGPGSKERPSGPLSSTVRPVSAASSVATGPLNWLRSTNCGARTRPATTKDTRMARAMAVFRKKGLLGTQRLGSGRRGTSPGAERRNAPMPSPHLSMPSRCAQPTRPPGARDG